MEKIIAFLRSLNWGFVFVLWACGAMLLLPACAEQSRCITSHAYVTYGDFYAGLVAYTLLFAYVCLMLVIFAKIDDAGYERERAERLKMSEALNAADAAPTYTFGPREAWLERDRKERRQ